MSEESGHKVRQLAELWHDCARNFNAFDKHEYRDPFSEAYFEILDNFSRPAPPDLWWEFILAAMTRQHNDESLAFFAAGPLEDFLCRYGDTFIGRVEVEAGRSPLFQRAVSGVWRNSMNESVWARVQVLQARAVACGNSLD
jgi:hypothetical protein